MYIPIYVCTYIYIFKLRFLFLRLDALQLVWLGFLLLFSLPKLWSLRPPRVDEKIALAKVRISNIFLFYFKGPLRRSDSTLEFPIINPTQPLVKTRSAHRASTKRSRWQRSESAIDFYSF